MFWLIGRIEASTWQFHCMQGMFLFSHDGRLFTQILSLSSGFWVLYASVITCKNYKFCTLCFSCTCVVHLPYTPRLLFESLFISYSSNKHKVMSNVWNSSSEMWRWSMQETRILHPFCWYVGRRLVLVGWRCSKPNSFCKITPCAVFTYMDGVCRCPCF